VSESGNIVMGCGEGGGLCLSLGGGPGGRGAGGAGGQWSNAGGELVGSAEGVLGQ